MTNHAAYSWNQDLETGNHQIDEQHKQLVAALNTLHDAARSGKGFTELARALEFLGAYTAKHFADEEKLQRQSGYPDYLRHKRYHDEFRQVARELSSRLVKEGPTDELLTTVYTTIGDWLVHHIKGDDFKMAAFVQSHDMGRTGTI